MDIYRAQYKYPNNGYMGASKTASYNGNTRATIPAFSNGYIEPPYLPLK
jgi:hypothetical protein